MPGFRDPPPPIANTDGSILFKMFHIDFLESYLIFTTCVYTYMSSVSGYRSKSSLGFMPFRAQFTFFALPPEVRCIIYDFCLNIGRVFPYYWASGAAKGILPPVALLRVCKSVHQEAEPFLYRNTFVFSRYQAIEKLFKVCLGTKERMLFLKSVEIGVFYNGIDARTALHQAQMMTIGALVFSSVTWHLQGLVDV